MNIKNYIAEKSTEYANLDLFQAFANDLIPVAEFPHFFKEQYMTARWFQDLIWATTEIFEGPYAEFAKNHRRKDSGHYKMMKYDLKTFGLQPMTDDDWFRLEWLPTRIQMSRILSLCHNASPDKRLVILASLESAGDVTLGTLFNYVERHGLAKKTKYLGEGHLKIEQAQVADIYKVAPSLMESEVTLHKSTIDTTFNALTTMFRDGGERYYKAYIHG